MMARLGAAVAKGIPYFVPAFLAVWFLHVLDTALGDPLWFGFDLALWLVASVLRVGASLSVLVVLARVHRVAHQSWGRALGAFVVWSVAGVTLLCVLAATRSWWAPLLTDELVVYFSPRAPAPGGAEVFRRAWIEPWLAGHVTAVESGLVVALSAVHALCAYFWGNRHFRSAAWGCAVSLLALVAYLYWCPWSFWDYDMFHGDILAGALVFSSVWPLAVDPYTTLAATAYLAAWATCLAYRAVVRA